MARTTRLAAALAATAGLLAVPATAGAGTSCTYTGAPFNFLEVQETASADFASLDVDPTTGEIIVRDPTQQLSCGATTPTKSNTDSIFVHNTGAGLSSDIVFIRNASRFVKSASNEIPITVNLNNGPDGQFSVFTDAAAGGGLFLGTPDQSGTETRINTNPCCDQDHDITVTGAQRLAAGGTNGGPDLINAQGGLGTGSPLTRGIRISGAGGADFLTGGDGNDRLVGGAGADTLRGMGGDDEMEMDGDTDDDSFDGGEGTDLVVPGDLGGPMSVDLALAGPQNAGFGNDSFSGVENLSGTEFADVLRGDAGPNTLSGGPGNDLLEGRGGIDTLDAGDGNDTLDVRDGGPDTADCGPGTDTVIADLPGIDTLLNCETSLFAAVATGGGGPSAIADVLAPFFSGKSKADPSKFEVDPKGKKETAVKSAKKGTTFKFTLSEAATVTFRIERKRGKKFKRVGAFRAQGKAGPNKKKFSGRIGKTTLKPGTYRALLTAVDAAGNRSQPAKISFTVVTRRRR